MARRIVALPVLIALAFLAAPLAAQVWSGGSAVGLEVRDRKKNPIEGAQVLLRYAEVEPIAGPPAAATGGDGKVEVQGLAPGRWRVDVSKDGFSSYLLVLAVEPDGSSRIVSGPVRDATGDRMRIDVFRVRPTASPEPQPRRPARAEPPSAEPARPAPTRPQPTRPEPVPPREVPPAQPAPAPAPAPPAEPEPVVEPEPPAEEPEAAPVAPAEAPGPVPEPAPMPEATPDAAPPPEPSPAPAPEPPAEPEPSPAPEPPAEPEPSPAPEPPAEPEPSPAPEPPAEPAPVPAPTVPPAAPEPAAPTAPEPAPAVEPEPPAPAEEPGPVPEPAPPTEPEPEPAPPEAAPAPPTEPAPQPPSEPAPAPAPAPEPAPAPPVEPAPQPPSEPAPTPQPAPRAAPPPAERPAPPRPAPDRPAEPPPPEQPAPPVAAAPRPAPAPPAEPPPLPWIEAELRSAADGDCEDCEQGTSALTIEQLVGSVGAAPLEGCAPDLQARLDRIAALLAGAGVTEAAPLISRQGGALQLLQGTEHDTEAAALVTPFLRRDSACQALVAVLPAGTEYVGYAYQASDAFGSGPCSAVEECAIGSASFIGQPTVVRTDGPTLIYGVFHNRSQGRERQARMIVYFRQ